MLLKVDAADTVVNGITPRDEQQIQPQSSSILPLSMQQRLAAWDDEDRHKGQQHEEGVWLTLEEREALEVDWQRQVDEVKEALRKEAEKRERERERQHQRERETWQAIERSRQEREKAEELIQVQRRQQLEDEDKLLQRAIEEKTQQLQQIQQQIEQQESKYSDDYRHGDNQQQNKEEAEVTQQDDTSQKQHLQRAHLDEAKAEVEEMERRLVALREEEEEMLRRMRDERRQLNRDNMTLLLAIERNKQQLQLADDEQSVDTASHRTHSTAQHTSQHTSPSSLCQPSAFALSPPQPDIAQRSDELRMLRQQLMDERRRVEAVQQRREAAESDNQQLRSQVRRLRDELRVLRDQQKQQQATLASKQQHYTTQLHTLQHHNHQLAQTAQAMTLHTEELEEEIATLKAENEAQRRVERHRAALSGGSGGKGKENVAGVKRVSRHCVDESDDGLDGLVDGLQGLRQTQAALHSHLRTSRKSPAPLSKTSTMPVSSAARPPPQSPPSRPPRQIVTPVSPALSMISSIDGDADLSCCEHHHPSRVHSHKKDTVLYTSTKASTHRLSAARHMR